MITWIAEMLTDDLLSEYKFTQRNLLIDILTIEKHLSSVGSDKSGTLQIYIFYASLQAIHVIKK